MIASLHPASPTPVGAGPGRHQTGSWAFASLAVGTVLLVPLAVVVANLFVPGGQAWDHLSATVLPGYIGTTLGLLAAVLAGVLIVGVGCAWLVAAHDFPGRRVLEWALMLPLAMPAYVVAYAYTDLLQFSGPVQTTLREFAARFASTPAFPDIRTTGGAAVVFTFVLYPYVYLLTRIAFRRQSASLSEAGRTLGLSPFGSFIRVALPLARPAMAAGAALALMETLADFGTVSYFGVQTFTTGIFRAWLSMGEPASAAKLSVILLVFVAGILALERGARQGARYAEPAAGRPRARVALHGSRRWVALLACGTPLVIGFVVPVVLLARLAMSGGGDSFGDRFLVLARNSTALATLAALITVAVAVLLAFSARISRSRLASMVNRSASLGYAVPGAVIAIGVLIPAARIDHALADLAGHLWGGDTGLILTGSILVLVYAYVIRFLAVALQTVEAGLAQVTSHMEDAARSLGMNARETLARVHVPILRSSLGTAALLVFVDVMKELPATFVMRPFDFDTLAVQAYNFAADERLAEASMAALAIVAVGLVPLAIAARRLVRGEAGPVLRTATAPAGDGGDSPSCPSPRDPGTPRRIS